MSTACATGVNVNVTGIMEHIEEAGIHSGDSACSLPVHTLSAEMVDRLEVQTIALAKALNVGGLMNVQFAIKDDVIHVLEVNPRASRNGALLSPRPSARRSPKVAARIMTGESLADAFARAYGAGAQPPHADPYRGERGRVPLRQSSPASTRFWGLKCARPERSWGSTATMRWHSPRRSLAPASTCRARARCFVSVRDEDKPRVLEAIRILTDIGFRVMATSGTADFLRGKGFEVEHVNKVLEGRPHIEDAIRNRQVHLVINTTEGAKTISDSKSLPPRRADAEGPLLHHHGRQPLGRPGHRRAESRKPGSAPRCRVISESGVA